MVPIPEDDGSCNHLTGLHIPSTSLPATDGNLINLSDINSKYAVVYCYPMTSRPGIPPPANWDDILGARGCTPQSCAFRDLYQEFENYNATVFGLSVQSTEYQQEAVKRLHLPFVLLSDESMEFTRTLQLPTFTTDGMELMKRLTLVIQDGVIQKVFYPVFPSDQNAAEVLEWLGSPRARP